MMDTDPTMPQIRITEMDDRVIVDVQDEAVVEDVVDAVIVVDEEPSEEFPALAWMAEVWRLQEVERFPDISASVVQTRPLGACFVYLYRTALPPEVIWQGKKFATLQEAQRAVWLWLKENPRQVSVQPNQDGQEPAPVADQGLGPCQE